MQGKVIAGKYRIDRLLGRGGMGEVVAAEHLQLGQTVAIKFLHPSATRDPALAARFLREARVLVSLRSTHVVRVIDMGALDDGIPYIVMEFLDGINLKTCIERRAPLPIAEAVGWVLQACEGIAEAHVLGIIHRDLKPSNLFLTERRD